MLRVAKGRRAVLRPSSSSCGVSILFTVYLCFRYVVLVPVRASPVGVVCKAKDPACSFCGEDKSFCRVTSEYRTPSKAKSNLWFWGPYGIYTGDFSVDSQEARGEEIEKKNAVPNCHSPFSRPGWGARGGAAGVRDVCEPESDMPCPPCVCFHNIEG